MAKGTVDVNINVNYQGKNTGGAGGTSGGGSTGGGGNSANEAKSIFDIQRQLTKEYRASASATGEISEQTKKLKAQLEKVNSDVRKFNEYGRESKNTWGNALNSYQFKFNALGNIIANVTSYATNMLKQLGASVFTISKDFEFAMSGVKAITQATDMEFKALTADAIRLGGATLYTARQVADLQTELAKLGFTVPEIRDATDGVVALAAATGEDLGQSALVAGTMIRAFGLQANQLTSVVDVMAESFNRSALDLYKFQETMKYVAPVASKTGFAIEEVTAMMAKLADAGVVGSQAGTSLRNLLLRLADANSKLAKAIGGPVNSLPELVIGLNKLTDAGLDSTKALQLADRYSVTALLALAGQAKGIWELYRSLVASNGAAREMSEVRMDNTAGSIERLTGAWDSLILTVNKGNGIFRVMIDILRANIEVITTLLSSRDQLASELSQRRLSKFKEENDVYMSDVKTFYAEQINLELDRYYKGEINLKEFQELKKKYNADEKTELNDIIDWRLKKELDASLVRRNIAQVELEDAKQIAKISSNVSTTSAVLSAQAKVKAEEESFNRIKEMILSNGVERAGILADIGELEIEGEEQKASELRRIQQEIKQARIDSLADGMAKELDIIELDYKEKIANAQKYGYDVKNIYQNMANDQKKVVEKYNDEIFKINDQVYAKLNADNYRITESIFDSLMGGKTWRERMDKLADDSRDDMKKLLEKITKPEEEDKVKRTIWDTLYMDDFGLSSEQKQSLEKGFDFIKDTLQDLADQEVEIADRRVENSERVVDQLQRDLQIEIALAEAGFASNVSLKRRELEQAKIRQNEALKLQEQAVKRQQNMESIIQAANLFTTGTEIVKGFTEKEPTTGWLIGLAAAAAMVGGYLVWKNNTQNKLSQYGEGGEISGAKHSQGGVPIEAEGGEFVVKASAYSKYADLVNAINEDKVNSVYGAMNRDLTVSLDDRKYDRMMGKYFGSTRTTYHNGYRIEQSGNRTRTIRYA